jgi:elongator complex protein 1
MPRGNLECIEPRMLIVHIIKYLLDNCDYKKVFNFMKKQRMNFNLIYDHDPELFTQNAEKFLKDVGNPEVLSLFLSTLQNEDVTKTIYSNCYNKVDARKSENKVGANKMAHICKLLRHVIEKQHNADELIQPLLITLLKSQNEEGLRTALIKIKELVLLENSQKPNCLLHISAEKALKFLLNAVDISILYDTALSMYDLELTMFIASKSQRDPKEYIPFLNSLKIMDEDYMKYTIDMHLKHYESALVHIAKDLSKFDKCLHLICSQKLYKQALKLFKKDTIEYKTIAAAFGEYLIQKKIYHEAGMMFYRSNDPEKALKAFMLAGSWEDSIIVLKKMEVR